jgi:hypothetical protein
MPQVLTTNALVLCPHGGPGQTLSAQASKWQVSGGGVAVEGDTGVIACPFLPLPCASYTLKSMGLNATQIDGKKVILVTDFNQSTTGLPLVMAEFHTTFDQSTPAQVAPGQPALPDAASLADFAAPVVVATPIVPAPTFVLSTSTPPVMTATFTIASNHPLRWILTLLDAPKALSIDLTNGGANVEVSPSGGKWNSPTLTIVVTLQAAFLVSLSAGDSHLFLTAVSKRGLSGHAEAVITVTPS